VGSLLYAIFRAAFQAVFLSKEKNSGRPRTCRFLFSPRDLLIFSRKKFNGYKEGKFLKIENIEPEELFGECLGSF